MLYKGSYSGERGYRDIIGEGPLIERWIVLHRRNRRIFGALVWLCLQIFVVTLLTEPAHALTFHEYEPPAISQVSCGSPQGVLRRANALTIYKENLYLAESLDQNFEFRNDEFSWPVSPAEPKCVSQLSQPSTLSEFDKGIAFGETAGATELYVGAEQRAGLHSSAVAVFGIGSCGTLECADLQAEWTGIDTPEKSFDTEVSDVAVDESTNPQDWAKGDVFVVAHGVHVMGAVDVFAPEADGKEKYLMQITETSPGNPIEDPANIAVSGFNGDLVIQTGNSMVDVFKPEGVEKYSFVESLSPPSGSFREVDNVAVDGGKDGLSDDGDIYVTSTTAIYEFNANGGFIGQLSGIPAQGVEPEHVFSFLSYRPTSITVDPISHRVFVGIFDSESDTSVIDALGPDITIPDVVTEMVSNLKLHAPEDSWKLKLNGEVDAAEGGEAMCHFVWGTSKRLENSTPCTKAVPNGSDYMPVHANLSGLAPGTTYYYRLEAGNIHGTNRGEESQNREFTTPGPGLVSESVAEVSSSSVRAEASITPHDIPVAGNEQELQEPAKVSTTYYFQYSIGDTAECDVNPSVCTDVPLTPANIGDGLDNVQVSQILSGLQPNATYHYRVVAANEPLPISDPGVVTQFFGSDRTFVTQGISTGTLALPDGRKWELVSPVNKHGALILPIGEGGIVGQAAENGGAFTYLTALPTGSEPQGYGDAAQLLATRGANGWQSTDIALSHSKPVGALVGVGHEYRYFSRDLSLGVAESFGPFSEPESEGRSESEETLLDTFPKATERTPYLRHNLTCETEVMTCYTPVVTGAEEYGDVPPDTKFGGAQEQIAGSTNFVGATPDLTDILVDSSSQLTTAPAPNGGLYEWSAGKSPQERLEAVSVLPTNEGGGVVSADIGGGSKIARNMVSNEGTRIFFTSGAAGDGVPLYMRNIDVGDPTKSETVRLDLPEPPSPPTRGEAVFQVASTTGKVAFFTDIKHLTKDSGTILSDLYRCEIIAVEETGSEKLKCALNDLTPMSAPGTPNAGESAAVQGAVLGASEDGSYVYFVANGVQASGASPGSCSETSTPPVGATCNLYVWHNGMTKFIAKLSAKDSPDWGGAKAPHSLQGSTARVSGNGEWLAFMSDRSLTGYDNQDAVNNMPDEEVYLYNAASGKIICASCDPSGARPIGVQYSKLNGGLAGGKAIWEPGQWLAANIPGWTPYTLERSLYQSRYLSNEGRLFFNTDDALVAQDTNGNEDVYEYEPTGVGACSSSGSTSTFVESSDGCVALISSGLAFGESAFLDASGSGGDVLFLTTGKLVSEDVDTALDVYDAHECIIPCPGSSKEERPVCESAASCRTSPALQPLIYGSPSSATFVGPENVVASSGKSVAKKIVLTRAQKLARALKTCGRDKSTKTRARCKRQARKRYGPVRLAQSTRKHAGEGR